MGQGNKYETALTRKISGTLSQFLVEEITMGLLLMITNNS